jgi:acyl-CoA synthetase
MPVAVTRFDDEVIRGFVAAGWWGTEPLSTRIVELAAGTQADSPAYIAAAGSLSWRDYDAAASELAGALSALGLERGSFVGVLLTDTPTTHVVYLALERAGLIIVGIGPRSGRHEIHHLLSATMATVLLTSSEIHGEDPQQLFEALATDLPTLRCHVVVDMPARVMPATNTPDNNAPGSARMPARVEVVVHQPAEQPELQGRSDQPGEPSAARAVPTQPFGPDDVFMVNATSGTTGLPKCVQHTQNRWIRFVQHAVAAGELDTSDVIMSALPSPFGFGLWSAHFLPPLLGVPAVTMPRWDATEALALMREHRVTVFAGVTTQLMMLLDLLEAGEPVPEDLRIVFTGGEAVPYERALRFETLTGTSVLQFYGSNESGALSCTTTADDTDHRLGTAGRVLDEMRVGLVHPATGEPLTGPDRLGQPTCYGPLISPGYLNDEAANAALVDPMGRLKMPDLATISPDGYLMVTGRVVDIIIRGGMNVSATEVEAALLSHPAIELAAVVGAPHQTFGEQVAAFVQTRSGATLTLDDIRSHLSARGMAKYTWPEQLYLVDSMPRNAGEKISKSALRSRLTGDTTT